MNEDRVDRWLESGSVYFSADRNTFYYGGHAGQGVFELREVDDSSAAILKEMIETNEISKAESPTTQACLGKLSESNTEFGSYWVSVFKIYPSS